MTGSLPPGCPIRKSMGQWVFAPRHGLSQLVTSFFASESLGIPHAPLFVPLFLSNRTSSMLAASKGTTFGSPCQLLTVSVHSVEQQRRRSLLLLLCLLAIFFSDYCVSSMSMFSFLGALEGVSILFRGLLLSVVLGRVELPTSTLSV